MTTTTRCWSTSTVETLTRPPDPSSSDWAPAIRAVVLSAVTVTVKVLLRVTFSSTGPGTGCQSSRSVVGSTGPPLAVGDGDGVLESVGDGSEVPGGGLGSGGTDESDAVQAVRARQAAVAASRRRTLTRPCCGPGARGWRGSS